MHTARPCALLMALVLVLLTACSAPWARQTPIPPDTRLVVTYISHDGGGLEALDGTTGTLLWKTHVGIIKNSRPTIEHGVVYAITLDHPGLPPHVVAVRERDGTLLWDVPMPYDTIPSITVDASTVALLIRGRELDALDPATGAQRWHVAANFYGCVMRHGVIYASGDPTPVSSRTPAASNNTSPSAYVPQGLMALNERDGSLVWQVREYLAFVPNAVTDRTIYGEGNPLGAMYAFDAQSGRQLTGVSHTAEGTPGATIFGWGLLLAATNRFVLLADYQSNPVRTRALSAVDGNVLWDVPVNFLNHEGVHITDDFIYSTEGPDYITAVRVRDGSVAWKRHFETDEPFSLRVIGGVVFATLAPQIPPPPFLCSDHCTSSVVALDAATGTVLWQHDADGAGFLAVPAQ